MRKAITAWKWIVDRIEAKIYSRCRQQAYRECFDIVDMHPPLHDNRLSEEQKSAFLSGQEMAIFEIMQKISASAKQSGLKLEPVGGWDRWERVLKHHHSNP